MPISRRGLRGHGRAGMGIALGVYVQHAYEKEKRDALELWADRLQGIISGGGEVVVMRVRR
jgi:hypothetical protein